MEGFCNALRPPAVKKMDGKKIISVVILKRIVESGLERIQSIALSRVLNVVNCVDL